MKFSEWFFSEELGSIGIRVGDIVFCNASYPDPQYFSDELKYLGHGIVPYIPYKIIDVSMSNVKVIPISKQSIIDCTMVPSSPDPKHFTYNAANSFVVAFDSFHKVSGQEIENFIKKTKKITEISMGIRRRNPGRLKIGSNVVINNDVLSIKGRLISAYINPFINNSEILGVIQTDQGNKVVPFEQLTDVKFAPGKLPI